MNKIVLGQGEQDTIWKYWQSDGLHDFNLAYPRLRFLAKQCPSGTRVLNIGVGSGYLEKLLADRGVEVYSLDPCGESIERLRNELSVGDRARQGYSSNIPFEKGYFDKVIMTEVIEHFPVDTLSVTLEEVRRVLKLGGEFTGTVPYREDLQASEVLCPNCKSQFHRWGHIQSFDTESFGDLLKHNGFYIKRLYHRSFPDFRRWGLKLFIKGVFRYVLGLMGEQLISPNLYFIAKVEGSGNELTEK